MQTHEYFEELCALLPIGQLTAEEYQKLAEHLRVCPSCLSTTGEFSVILDKMPVGETDVDEKTLVKLQGDSYRTRFLKRATAEGIPFSDAVIRSRLSIRNWWPRLGLMRAIAAVAITAIFILLFQVSRLSRKASELANDPATQSARPAASISNLQDQHRISELEAEIREVESEPRHQRALILDLTTKLDKAREEASDARQGLAKSKDQLMQVQNQASETERALASTKADLARLRAEKDSEEAALVDQQVKINELVARVKEKEALLERERQLDSVARDVREIMGARNLHILDVSDVDGNGRSQNSFGRVFLVEGETLIFYAFDLGNRGNPAKVSFQAWGQFEGRQATAKNLGVFYVDDHAQKRWVLKVNDPEKLTAINSVFVTVEPLGGANKPTGKKLLYAYLGNQPNHP